MKKSTSFEGKAYVVGDNVDTDQIIPAEHLKFVPTIAEEYEKLGSFAMSGLSGDYPAFVAEGRVKSEFAVMVAGKNFGCGSSREHAPVSMGASGLKAVVAESYARIFYRNAVSTGELFPCECAERLCDIVQTGDMVRVDIAACRMVHNESGRSFALRPLGAAMPVIEAGGLFEYARRTGMI